MTEQRERQVRRWRLKQVGNCVGCGGPAGWRALGALTPVRPSPPADQRQAWHRCLSLARPCAPPGRGGRGRRSGCGLAGDLGWWLPLRLGCLAGRGGECEPMVRTLESRITRNPMRQDNSPERKIGVLRTAQGRPPALGGPARSRGWCCREALVPRKASSSVFAGPAPNASPPATFPRQPL